MSLRIENLHIEYPDQIVFDQVNLLVENGEIIAVQTNVLDGATSLLKAIAGLLNGVQGSVRLDETELIGEFVSENRTDIGFVYEAHGLVSLFTVLQNIMLPLQYHTDLDAQSITGRLDELFEQLHLDPRIHTLRPHQLNDVQTRLVNLTRALIVQPRLLLIDELEGGMSDEAIGDIIQVLRDHQKKHPMCIIMTTGVEEILNKADRSFRIENHNLIEIVQ